LAGLQPAIRMIGADVGQHHNHRTCRPGGRPRTVGTHGPGSPTQHPAVVLRSHFNQLRALLAVALIALIGLTVAVVILASDEDQLSDTSSAPPIGQLNYGGFNPATGRPESAPLPQQEHPLRSRLGTSQSDAPITGSRYDGGPDEGTRGAVKDYSKNSATGDVPPPGTRYDGGPEEGTRGVR
jgi:hypothetical protein